MPKRTKLLFKTPVGGQTLSLGTTTVLTSTLPNSDINVSDFSAIRVTGNNRIESATSVTYLLTHNIDGEFFTFLDTITVAQGKDFSKSYDVPGTGLTIQVQTAAGTGSDTTIDVAVFGFQP